MKTISSKLLDDEKAQPPPPKEPEKVKYGTEKVNNRNIYNYQLYLIRTKSIVLSSSRRVHVAMVMGVLVHTLSLILVPLLLYEGCIVTLYSPNCN